MRTGNGVKGVAITARGREKIFGADAKKTFVRVLSETFNVAKACQACGFVRWTVYNHRKKDPDFATEWDHAIECVYDQLEESLFERAMKNDTAAAIFLLKSGRPGKYAERRALEVTGKDGGPIQYRELTRGLRDDLSRRIALLAVGAEARSIPGGLECGTASSHRLSVGVLGTAEPVTSEG